MTKTSLEREKLSTLRNVMRGADVPVVLFTWMQEVEDQLEALRNEGTWGVLKNEGAL